MNDGIILIDKPAGMTSFGVVARLRRVLSAAAGKKIKVGHTGTLDPFATGLMIVVIGKECKNAQAYSKLDKEYSAVLHLGQISTTGDPEGELKEINQRKPSKEEIETVVNRFLGEIKQRPPAFSALKINGRRAYKIAREGGEVELPLRSVKVYNLAVEEYRYPLLTIRVRVSSGTYIRSLAQDIGEALKVGAYCEELRRVSVGKWHVKEAKQLSDFGITD